MISSSSEWVKERWQMPIGLRQVQVNFSKSQGVRANPYDRLIVA